MEDQMNAIANVMAYYQNGWIELIKERGFPVGIWTKSFPTNTTKKSFLSMFCALQKQLNPSLSIDDFHMCILSERYMITDSSRGEGFDIFIQ